MGEAEAGKEEGNARDEEAGFLVGDDGEDEGGGDGGGEAGVAEGCFEVSKGEMGGRVRQEDD